MNYMTSAFKFSCSVRLPTLISVGAKRYSQTAGNILEISPEVQYAIQNSLPVVALESTIITHGMPFPKNLETAMQVESTIRARGAVPATIGIMKGRVHVGLTESQLKELALKELPCVKTSRRDIPFVLSQKLNGGTTVSATMLIASKAGIPIFVTGGIGGVHRGAETTFDVSADLTELGRTPVAVVSSGVKSILDIEKTLEYLETQGVCVATLGTRRDFPAFFTPTSGFLAPYHVENPTEAARLIHHNITFNSGSGLLIAVPIPDEYQADGQVIEVAIQEALVEAGRRNIRGKDVTPFVLSQVNQLTMGASLTSNVALINNNAAMGASIAVELTKMRKSHAATSLEPGAASIRQRNPTNADDCQSVVVGGSIVDLVVTVKEDNIQMDSSTHRGTIRQSFGGVGRNIADGLSHLTIRPLFISTMGNDSHADDLIAHNPLMETRGLLRLAEASTATYAAILDRNGDYRFGVGDLEIHDQLSVQWVRKHEEDIAKCRLLIMDGNVPLPTMDYILAACDNAQVPVWYEPTDVKKASKPMPLRYWSSVAYTSPNWAELLKMVQFLKPNMKVESRLQNIEEIREHAAELCQPLLQTMDCVLITLGEHGLMVVRRGDSGNKFPLSPRSHGLSGLETISATHYPAPKVDKIISVSGAGDCLAAGFITGILKGWNQEECASFGLKAAECSLQHSPAVPSALSHLVRKL